MNKKNFKFVIAFIIFFIMIFGLLVSQIGSFAVVAEKPIYINLGKSKNVNGKNIGYGINDPTESTGNYIWQINQYNSNNVNDKVTNARNLYCIKAEYGKSWVSNGGKETNIVEYNLSYDLEQQREEILKKLVDSSDENTVIKNLLTPEKGAYNQILWILDNAYIPGTTNKEEYLKKFNAVYDVAVGDTLTDEDIIAIQKMVIWYFTNYIIHDDITYNPSNRWEIYNQTDSETGSWLKITNDNWATQASIGEGNNENRRKYESDLLYKNLIKAANDGASEYNTTRTPVSINTNGLTKVADNKYKISIKKVGEYYVLGPIKLNGTNNVNSSITLKTTDKNGNEITDYKISDSEGNEQNKTINDYIGNEDGFYIKVSSTNGKTIKISLNITNSGTKKTLWLGLLFLRSCSLQINKQIWEMNILGRGRNAVRNM